MRTQTIFYGVALTVAVFAAQAGCSGGDDTSVSEQAASGGNAGNDASAQGGGRTGDANTGGASAGSGGTGAGGTDASAGGADASAGGADASAGGTDASAGGADASAGGTDASASTDAAGGTDTGAGGATDAAAGGGGGTDSASADGAMDAGLSDASDGPAACDAGPAPDPAAYDLIADWEDGTTNVLTKNGRQGYLFEINENLDQPDSGVQVPPPNALVTTLGGHACSKHAFRSTGSGFNVWGAEVGLTLNATGGLLSSYNASGYTAIRFWAKSGSASDLFVAVSIPNKQTIPEGGVCGADAEAGDGCNNHFTQIVGIPGTWTEITVAFANLAQDPSWGYRTGQPFDASAVYEILFSFQPDNGAIPFDFWLDDVAFVK